MGDPVDDEYLPVVHCQGLNVEVALRDVPASVVNFSTSQGKSDFLIFNCWHEFVQSLHEMLEILKDDSLVDPSVRRSYPDGTYGASQAFYCDICFIVNSPV